LAHDDDPRLNPTAFSGIQNSQYYLEPRSSIMRTDPPMLGRTPVDWLYCRDGKWRPVEPGTFPLAHEAPSRVGRLRAYGNALDLETATQFCKTVKEICDGI
jgi:DNA (cytosine-5)-methyltransferase 1